MDKDEGQIELHDISEKETPAAADEKMVEKRERSFLSRALRFVIGVSLSVLLGAALGVAGYLGLPLLYRGFTDTVDANARRIASLESNLDRERSESAAANEAEAERVNAFEGALAAQNAELEDLQSQLDSLASSLDEQTRRSGSLSSMERTLDQQATTLEELENRMQVVELAIVPGGGPLAQLERDLLLTQAMTAMIRARIWLLENDLGSATVEVERARELVTVATEGLDDTEAAPLRAVVDRLDLTLADLLNTPFVASNDLEIAWTLLIEAMESGGAILEAEETTAP